MVNKIFLSPHATPNKSAYFFIADESNIPGRSLLSKIKNAGSICLGKYAVMAMTDYNIGTNHVLPTNGTAKYSSGISVNEFNKRISYINLTKKGIESLGPSVITLANYEGLVGHAQSVVTVSYTHLTLPTKRIV